MLSGGSRTRSPLADAAVNAAANFSVDRVVACSRPFPKIWRDLGDIGRKPNQKSFLKHKKPTPKTVQTITLASVAGRRSRCWRTAVALHHTTEPGEPLQNQQGKRPGRGAGTLARPFRKRQQAPATSYRSYSHSKGTHLYPQPALRRVRRAPVVARLRRDFCRVHLAACSSYCGIRAQTFVRTFTPNDAGQRSPYFHTWAGR